MSRKVTASQKHQVMSKLLASPAGRSRIAANIQEPLRKLRDYQAIGRRAFFVDELPDGTLPIYDKDVETPAYVVAEEADSIQTMVKGSRMLVPLMELASYPKVPFTQVKERRFDIVKRIKQKAQDELFRLEDRLIFAAMTKAGSSNTGTTAAATVAKAAFEMGVLADQYAKVETSGLRVDKVFMNASQVPVLRKAGRDYLDFETQREILRTGFIGTLWGASIYTSPEVPSAKIFMVTEPEYFGVMPIRIDLTVIPADDPGARSYGWSIFQQIGIGIHNSQNGLQQLTITG